MGEILLVIIALILLASGLLGIFLPFVPGVPLAWLGLFIYSYSHQFEPISLTTILVFLGLTILTMAVDVIAPLIGAKKYHASRYGVLGSSIGLLLGMFVLGPIGIIAGPFLGALVGEFAAGKGSDQAFSSAIGTFLGFLAGSLIKLIVILVMIGFFIVSLF